MSTKITTPVLIDLPGETLSSENTSGVILPKGTTGERPGSISVEYLVVAGGGGGGSRTGSAGSGAGGGGAGGLLTSWSSGTALSVSLGASIDITVGEGGIGANTPNTYTKGGDGGDSIFASITATGGGGGASGPFGGNTGGSGGGSGYNGTGGSGTIGQGNDGGSASGSGGGGGVPYAGSGGGGAGGAGGNGAPSSTGGAGGAGLSIDITNASVTYAAGGDGSIWTDGGSSNESNNTGNGSDGAATAAAGNGGSGVVILRYPDTYTIVETTSVLTFTTDSTSVANTKITTFTAGTSGVIQFTPTITPSTGEFRYNTTDKLVEFYNGSTWKQIADEYISGQPSTCICNFPTTASALFQFNDNVNDTCGGTAPTPTNITYVTGKYGKAANFNGSSSKIVLDGTLKPNGPWSISYWFNTNTVSKESAHYLGDWINGQYTLMIKNYYDKMYVYGYSCAGSGIFNTQPLIGSTTITTGTWFHVVVVLDNVTTSSGVTIYIDGASVGTTTLSSGMCTSGTEFTIGWEPPVYSYMDGEIDQMRFFNTALTASQVTELYNEVVCT